MPFYLISMYIYTVLWKSHTHTHICTHTHLWSRYEMGAGAGHVVVTRQHQYLWAWIDLTDGFNRMRCDCSCRRKAEACSGANDTCGQVNATHHQGGFYWAHLNPGHWVVMLEPLYCSWSIMILRRRGSPWVCVFLACSSCDHWWVNAASPAPQSDQSQSQILRNKRTSFMNCGLINRAGLHYCILLYFIML